LIILLAIVMSVDCDVLVVGGGPAGSSAARASAKMGAKTILIEEHEEIGVPVQCAEGIGKYLIPFLPFKIPQEQLRWEIKGMTFWVDDILIKRDGGIWSGYTVDRAKWDQWLSSLAKDEGAEIKLNSKLIDLEFDDDYQVKKAIVKSKGKKIEIHPKIVIAADGVESTVVDLLGVKKKQKDSHSEIVSYEMKNLDLTHPYHDQLFSLDYAPYGYGYIFPISKKKANVGIGSILNRGNIEEFYDRFIEMPFVKKQVKNGSVIVEKKGIAPFRYETDDWTYGNVILTGDTANQNYKPFIEGNLPGIICGDIAGNHSYEVLKNQRDITQYKNLIMKKQGPMFKASDDLLNIMLDYFDNNNQHLLNILMAANLCSLNKIRQFFNQDREEIIEIIHGWNDSKMKQFSTDFIERYYLFYLYLWRKTRLF